MILPIVAYGDPVLRKVCDPITQDYTGLTKLIEDMFQTMYQSNGVGIAAPQVGLPIRLFLVDTEPFLKMMTSLMKKENISRLLNVHLLMLE